MKTYLIQRNVPGAGKLSTAERRALAQKSNEVLGQMGAEHIQWLQSHITDDHIWCVYKAQNEKLVREHAKRGCFPADNILEIFSTISPVTAEMVA